MSEQQQALQSNAVTITASGHMAKTMLDRLGEALRSHRVDADHPYTKVFDDIKAERERVLGRYQDGWGYQQDPTSKARIVLQQAAKVVPGMKTATDETNRRQLLVELAETCVRWIADIDSEHHDDLPF